VQGALIPIFQVAPGDSSDLAHQIGSALQKLEEYIIPCPDLELHAVIGENMYGKVNSRDLCAGSSGFLPPSSRTHYAFLGSSSLAAACVSPGDLARGMGLGTVPLPSVTERGDHPRCTFDIDYVRSAATVDPAASALTWHVA
jgi:hypothetical protein